MHVLSLCSGAGGLELGIQLAVPAATTIAYCERDACAVEVLAARMEDGSLAPAPIWFDLRSIGGALAGHVDLVAAGFPCQPHSVAGKRGGAADERWLWPEVWRIVRDVRSPLLFLENVPGLLSSGGFDAILGDLAASGWAAEWDCVPAAAVGAPHLRDRLFLLAADPDRARLEVRGLEPARDQLAPAERGRDWWAAGSAPEPAIRGVDDGLARALDRDRLFVLGNGVVPAAAAEAWRVLWGRMSA